MGIEGRYFKEDTLELMPIDVQDVGCVHGCRGGGRGGESFAYTFS
jgi:hypothetical protein